MSDPLGKGPVTIELNHTLAELLAKLCVELETEDPADVLSRALGLLEMVQRTKRQGGRLCFVNERGEFYGEDVEDGRPIKVRYSWVKRDADHARWEQAYSFDNTTWETNWISEFVRADPASHCVAKGQAPASR